MTELEKRMSGEVYDRHDKIFIEMKSVATRWMQHYNSLPYERRPERYTMFRELFGGIGTNCSTGDDFICEFECNIYLGN